MESRDVTDIRSDYPNPNYPTIFELSELSGIRTLKTHSDRIVPDSKKKIKKDLLLVAYSAQMLGISRNVHKISLRAVQRTTWSGQRNRGGGERGVITS